MKAEKLVRLTLTEDEFKICRDALFDRSIQWTINGQDAKYSDCQNGIKILQQEVDALYGKFDDIYRDLFIHNTTP